MSPENERKLNKNIYNKEKSALGLDLWKQKEDKFDNYKKETYQNPKIKIPRGFEELGFLRRRNKLRWTDGILSARFRWIIMVWLLTGRKINKEK